jgi:hypothetical protein
MHIPIWLVGVIALALTTTVTIPSAQESDPAILESARHDALQPDLVPADIPVVYRGDLARFTAAEWEQAERETVRFTLPGGHGVKATYGPDGLKVETLPLALLHPHLEAAALGDTAGCAAIPPTLSAGWVVPTMGECEPNVSARYWFDTAPRELVFITYGIGVGGVNAVNFPMPWVQARHGVFVLWCDLQGAGSVGVGTLLFHPTGLCHVIRIGLPLAQYDQWTSHVGTHDGVGPHQVLSGAAWALH